MANPTRSTSNLIKTQLISWLTLILIQTLWFSVAKSRFCPVTSPNDELVYVTDTPSKLIIGLTKTGCAIECYAKYRDCRCFNFNVTSLNCSLFNFEPTSYGVDKSNNTRAYEVEIGSFMALMLGRFINSLMKTAGKTSITIVQLLNNF
jgi:hypothetical protein